MTAFYNEIDPKAAAWLRELIAQGHIAPGVVDERSIEDISPEELNVYTQCHFFAGIGGWGLALRMAGWPDDRPVWTGSCPCQPFSAAGKGGGFADERHLWPHFHWLISQCRPATVFGEQVASRDGLDWFDLVHADLEGAGYAVGAADLCAAGFGAPHIRQRLYWVADADQRPRAQGGEDVRGRVDRGNAQPRPGSGCGGMSSGLAHSNSLRLEPFAVTGLHNAEHHAESRSSAGGVEYARHHDDAGQDGPASDGQSQADQSSDFAGGSSVSSGWLADAVGGQHIASGARPDQRGFQAGDGSHQGRSPTRPTNGHWRDTDWLRCRDGKWRPVEPGTFPLAHGVSERVGLLRGYGNAIVPQVASAFIEAYLDARGRTVVVEQDEPLW